MRKLIAGLALGVGSTALMSLLAWPGWLETDSAAVGCFVGQREAGLNEELSPLTKPLPRRVRFRELHQSLLHAVIGSGDAVETRESRRAEVSVQHSLPPNGEPPVPREHRRVSSNGPQ